ncbi:hypothetical protein L3Q82_009005, partial [Scortum barcoo]
VTHTDSSRRCVSDPDAGQSPGQRAAMVRRKSVVWGFFKTVDSESVQCLLCGGFMVRQGHSTANMLRHLRVKHPTEVPEASSSGSHQDLETDCQQVCSVEVMLEDKYSDTLTSGSEAGINSAINGALETASPAEQITHEEAGDDRPARRRRSLIWRHFECLDSFAAARCRLCMKKLQCFEGGSTSNLHRHMLKRHPEVFSQQVANEKKPPQDNGDTPTPEETVKAPFSVEVMLEDKYSDTLTSGNEAIDSSLEAVGPAEQITREEAGDDRPARRGRNKRSLIWRHYEHLDSLAAARCRLCMKKLQCFESGSTSNLHRHMLKRHPEVFSQQVANGKNPPQDNGDTPTPDALEVSRASKGEKRVFRRELQLIEALRRAQREEARALEQQRELLEKLRAANTREAAAEREQIELLRKAQLEEAKELSRQKEELQKEKAELQKKCEELQQDREELLLFSRGQQVS